MMTHEWIGYLAAMLTTTSFVPQVWQIWRTKRTQDISLRMYVLFTAGIALWLAYGVLIGAWPVIVANTVTLALTGTVLFLKLRHG